MNMCGLDELKTKTIIIHHANIILKAELTRPRYFVTVQVQAFLWYVCAQPKSQLFILPLLPNIYAYQMVSFAYQNIGMVIKSGLTLAKVESML